VKSLGFGKSGSGYREINTKEENAYLAVDTTEMIIARDAHSAVADRDVTQSLMCDDHTKPG
jgi:hypothetical protein